jgi:triacylglycerol lipase
MSDHVAQTAGSCPIRSARVKPTLRILILGLLLSSVAHANEGVILLHGLCRSSRSMAKLEAAFSAAGYTVVNVDYSSRDAAIRRTSHEVIGRALADPRLQPCSRVHFVTHSLGGILVRSYFAEKTDARLGRVVMLGPPNQGSEVVDRLKSWWLFRKINGPAGSELGTDATSVPNSLGPVNFELGVIAGDRSINGINSLLIAGADDGKVSVQRTKVPGMKEHLIVHVSHPFLMKDRGVIAAALRFVATGRMLPPDKTS